MLVSFLHISLLNASSLLAKSGIVVHNIVLFSSQFVVQLELFLSSGTVSLSIYSLVGAIFGMNIPYTWNDGYGYMFKWVRTVFPPVILASMTVICG